MDDYRMDPAKAQRIAANEGPVFAGERAVGVVRSADTPANAKQVGGDHYKVSYQHWDFVVDLQLDYFEACATKYVTRWRKKNGLEDLQKSPHYIEKRQELVEAKRLEGRDRRAPSVVMQHVLMLAKANDLDAWDIEAIYRICIEDRDAVFALHELIKRATPAEAAG
jgi:hypothetical protein